MKNLFLAVGLVLVMAAGMLVSPVQAEAGVMRTVEGRVTKVSDGDTVQVVTADGTKLRVRLYGADAPETPHPGKSGQPYGEESARALGGKVAGRDVTLQIMDVDQYKRMVAVVLLDGRDVNMEMVREGWAWAYRQYLDRPHASGYIQAEELARKERRGLWQQGNRQTPPWEFRKSLRGSR